MSKAVKMIGLAGNSRAGKDSLYICLQRYFLEKAWRPVVRQSLGDILKKELDPILIQNFGITAFTCDSEKKTLIRPLLVHWAEIRRRQTKGSYFTHQLTPSIHSCLKQNIIPCITDIRYKEYAFDEYDWLRFFDGTLIYVERFDENGNLTPPANDHEARNNVFLRKNADLIVSWPTLETEESRYQFVKPMFDVLFNG